MTNHFHDLPVARQCKALQLDHITIYREPTPVKQSELNIMTLTDSFYMERPELANGMVRERLTVLGISNRSASLQHALSKAGNQLYLQTAPTC